MKRIAMLSLTAIIAAAATLAAAPPATAQDSLEFARVVPPGALVYVEVADFGGRLQQFLKTDFARKFPETRAFKDFTTTKLFNKLGDRIGELEQATGFGLTLERVAELAGGRSALALYDIGELQFVFLTRMPFEKAAATALWNLRSQFEERIVEGVNYFFKEDPDGRTALMFAIVGDTLVAGTDLLRFEASLKLLNKKGGDTLAASESFAAALPSGFGLEDAFLYLDQERIAETPHFRSYWIFGNQEELRRIRQAVISLRIGAGGITETRWFTTADAAGLPEMKSVGALAAVLPRGRELYSLAGIGDDAGFSALLAGALYEDAGKNIGSALEEALAPAVPQEYGLAVGGTFDEDKFFITVDKTFVVALGQPHRLDRSKLERALALYFEQKLLAPGGQAELKFADRGGLRALDVPLFEGSTPGYRIDGPLLVITNDAAAFGATHQGGVDPKAALGGRTGLRSALVIDSAAAAERLTAYFKIVSQRDNWRSGGDAAFFWRNAVSLLDSLGFLKSVTVVGTVDAGKVKEEVAYAFK
jgi:hypothetical protein